MNVMTASSRQPNRMDPDAPPTGDGAQPTDLVGEMLDDAGGRRASAPSLLLAHGRRVSTVTEGKAPASALEIRGPAGDVELRLDLTPQGPRLRVCGIRLELTATEAITMRCGVFELEAERGATIAAPRGDVTLDAGDDVVIVGERVRLN